MTEKKKENDHYLKRELYDLVGRDTTIFDFLQDGSLDGIWYWDLESPENEWMSPRFWNLLGYDPQEKQHLAAEWQDMIFKDDLKVALDNFKKHCQDPNHPYDQIVRYRHRDGSTVWVRCRGLAIRDESGKAIRMLGAHVDLTDLKVNETEITTGRERYQAVVETAKEAIVSADSKSEIIDWNQSAETIFGWSAQEVMMS